VSDDAVTFPAAVPLIATGTPAYTSTQSRALPAAQLNPTVDDGRRARHRFVSRAKTHPGRWSYLGPNKSGGSVAATNFTTGLFEAVLARHSVPRGSRPVLVLVPPQDHRQRHAHDDGRPTEDEAEAAAVMGE